MKGIKKQYRRTGKAIDARHDSDKGNPTPSYQNLYTRGMSVCVRPPPRLPQPPAVALAVPTTLRLNMMEFQNWFTTKVDPRQDTKKRAVIKPGALTTAALQETTIIPQASKKQSDSLGPNFSITDPMMKRVKTSNETAAMFALPMAALHDFL